MGFFNNIFANFEGEKNFQIVTTSGYKCRIGSKARDVF